MNVSLIVMTRGRRGRVLLWSVATFVSGGCVEGVLPLRNYLGFNELLSISLCLEGGKLMIVVIINGYCCITGH